MNRCIIEWMNGGATSDDAAEEKNTKNGQYIMVNNSEAFSWQKFTNSSIQ